MRADAAVEVRVDQALAMLFGDDAVAGAAILASARPDLVLARARYHGVLPLLAGAAAGRTSTLPPWLDEAAHASVRAEAALDLVRRPMVVEVLDALESAGTGPLVLKGEALAHSHYATPWQRPRADTDILVAPDQGQAAERILASLVHRRGLLLPGIHVSAQSSHYRDGPAGFVHAIDLHWRINNSNVLSQLIGHRDLRDRALPIPALGPAARAPTPAHALLIACLHRVASEHAPYIADGIAHIGGDRLIWLADIDRLVRGFDETARTDFVASMRARGAGALAASGIRAAARAFATTGAHELIDALASSQPSSLTDRYLAAGARGREWLDFHALPGARARVRFLREVLWPGADYLRARRPGSSGRSVLGLNLERLAGGLLRRLR